MNLKHPLRTALQSVTAATFLIAVANGSVIAAPTPDPFALKNTPELLGVLGADKAIPSSAIETDFPNLAENPNTVSLKFRSRLPNTESLTIIIENNPTPLAAIYRPHTNPESLIVSRVRMAKSSPVHVVVRAGGKTYITSKFIKVTPGGCGGGSYTDRVQADSSKQIGQTRFKTTVRDAVVDIQSLIQHPMETGLRPINDAGDMTPAIDAKTGKPVSPHYIQRVVANVGGKAVFEAQWGPSIAVNPFMGFEIERPAKGEALTLHWQDSLGKSGQAVHTLSN